MKAKKSFVLILILLAFSTFLGCEKEGGNVLNKIVAKTVDFFSPKEEVAAADNARIFNLISAQENAGEGTEEEEEELDSALIDSLKAVGEALNWKKVVYMDRGKPDPFAPLLTSSETEGRRVNVDLASLSGIIWVKDEYFAIVKEGNRGYVLKEGDPVVDGRVARITKSSITFSLRKFGEQLKVTLSLKKQER